MRKKSLPSWVERLPQEIHFKAINSKTHPFDLSKHQFKCLLGLHIEAMILIVWPHNRPIR